MREDVAERLWLYFGSLFCQKSSEYLSVLISGVLVGLLVFLLFSSLERGSVPVPVSYLVQI